MLVSPAAERSQDALLSVLQDVLDDQAEQKLFALELGSGTGQHVVHFAQGLGFITWQPSDITEESRNRYTGHLHDSVSAKLHIILQY